MKSRKTKTRLRSTVPENAPALASSPGNTKIKPKKHLGERPSRSSLKSRIGTKGRLSNILENIDSVVWSIAADTYETLYVNPAAETIYGRPASAFYAVS